jgi:hypothetical protein
MEKTTAFVSGRRLRMFVAGLHAALFLTAQILK